MKLNTLIPIAIATVIVLALAGCTGELQLQRVEGKTELRLKLQNRPTDQATNATGGPVHEGEPSEDAV